MARIVLIRHTDEPDDDRAVSFLRQLSCELETVKLFKGDALGEAEDSVAASIVYGGPFNTFEENRHAFLNDENRWIEQYLTKEVPILCICQAAQSMTRDCARGAL